MIQRHLKLRLITAQATQLDTWLWHLTGVWNEAIHKLGIPRHTLQGLLDTAYTAWHRCGKKLAQKPQLKGQRNTLTSIPFPDPFQLPAQSRLPMPGFGRVRCHPQALPPGGLTSGRLVRGWRVLLARVWPVPRMRSCGECSPPSARQAVGSTLQSLPGIPPRPARHVGACLLPLATRACQ